jgi:hypothetical protein
MVFFFLFIIDLLEVESLGYVTHDLGNFELKVNHRFSSSSFWRAIITCVLEQLHVSLCIFIGPKGECCFLFGSPLNFVM